MTSRPAWRRKRLLIPAALALITAGVAAIAILRSDQSSVVVYNHTGSTIPLLRISACGHSATHRSLETEDSWRWRPQAGVASEMELELATEPPVQWTGGYLQPRGGFRVTLHLWPGGVVEDHTQISFWQRVLRGAPRVDD